MSSHSLFGESLADRANRLEVELEDEKALNKDLREGHQDLKRRLFNRIADHRTEEALRKAKETEVEELKRERDNLVGKLHNANMRVQAEERSFNELHEKYSRVRDELQDVKRQRDDLSGKTTDLQYKFDAECRAHDATLQLKTRLAKELNVVRRERDLLQAAQTKSTSSEIQRAVAEARLSNLVNAFRAAEKYVDAKENEDS